jgi:hypothetical protein
MDGGGSGVSLSYAFSKIELVAWIGLMLGTYGLLPESAQPDWDGLMSAFDIENAIPAGFLWWGAACHMVVVTLVEPFYVGAGFALYLNCRTRIEGWDVELAFRRMATRLTSAAAAMVIAVLAVFGMQPSVQAAEGREPAKVIQEVLKKPEFEIHKVQTKEWVPEFDVPESKRIGATARLFGRHRRTAVLGADHRAGGLACRLSGEEQSFVYFPQCQQGARQGAEGAHGHEHHAREPAGRHCGRRTCRVGRG